MRKINKFLAVFLSVTMLMGISGCGASGDKKVSESEEVSTQSVSIGSLDPGEGNSGNYKLEEMLVLSRHNIRSPLSTKDSELSSMTTHTWIEWSSDSGQLSLRGGVLETEMGEYFRKYVVSKGLMEENAIPSDEEVRIYANSKQRTIATAQYFTTGFLPVANETVEHHCEVDQMDPVFNPVLTFVNDAFEKKAREEIAAMGGSEGLLGITKKLKNNFELVENVIDFKNSAYAKENGVTSFATDDLEIQLVTGNEPTLTGGLRQARIAADALTLQYYETADAKEAAFGNDLTDDEWKQIGEVVDAYQDTLFTSKSVAVNVANPLLKEIKSEITNQNRKFTFLCGHDSNLGSVMAALDIAEFDTEESLSNKTPIGSKLVFQKWLGEDQKEYVTVSLVYQTTSQLRGLSLLNIDNPPAVITLHFENMAENEDGFYNLEDVTERFDNAISEYDLLKNEK